MNSMKSIEISRENLKKLIDDPDIECHGDPLMTTLKVLDEVIPECECKKKRAKAVNPF